MKGKGFLIIVLVAGLLIGASILILSKKQKSDPKQQIDIQNLLQTGNAPWSIGTDSLKERLTAISLPALPSEGTVLHIHAHLDIFVNGQNIEIPANIGINPIAGFFSPIHTHDTTGIIHIESPTVQTFTLGQFFDIWGVRFNDRCLGGYCDTSANRLQVYVNGQAVNGNFRGIQFDAHQEIAAVYGNPPQNIPANFNFPPGY